ncbi:type II secretion system protein [Saccharospirillum salsuginis]|uniref:MSHA pilin protein MshA n=1 Tax=Saccharospirillum salsuginis TaxID=418750 RepID=A0A918N7V7_9GAMM|nr:prepilin-type N-terminal cleavage/methylation domain-containing protein [Saccharospirillum salsuginis]GGX45621.1 hypothetical protein GCM10007392_10820 [Saccharospirillum salsuginis]
MMKQQKGFTLIELIMVIVILGILSAFALPRFVDLSSDARTSALEGAIGSVKSARGIARAACLSDSGCDESASGETVTMDGTSVDMENGNPAAAAGGIDVAAQIADDFVLGTPSGTAPNRTVVISADDGSGSAVANCNFTYDESDGSTSSVTTTGC